MYLPKPEEDEGGEYSTESTAGIAGSSEYAPPEAPDRNFLLLKAAQFAPAEVAAANGGEDGAERSSSTPHPLCLTLPTQSQPHDLTGASSSSQSVDQGAHYFIY